MSRIELYYGDATPSAFVDLAKSETHVYTPGTAEALHERFGGKRYYQSRSGRTGAGWIPACPTLRQCAVLRTDENAPKFPKGGEVMPGIWLIVPTADLGREVMYSVLVRRGRGDLFVLQDYELTDMLPRILRGERPEGGISFNLTSWWGWEGSNSPYQERPAKVTVWGNPLHRGIGKLGRRRLLELVFNDQLDWGQVDWDATTPWYAQLGLAVGRDRNVYHSGGRLLRRRADLGREALVASCPWAFFLEGSLDFIVQRDDQFILVRREPTEMDWSGRPVFEQTLDAVDVLAAYQTGVLPEKPDVSDISSLTTEQIEEAMLATGEE